MYRPFCVQDNSAAATICSYTPLTSIPFPSAQQKRSSQQPKRAGQGRGVLPPFRQKSPATALPLFCLISLASTTNKLIFESYVIVTYLT
jgi:hypothetical protein